MTDNPNPDDTPRSDLPLPVRSGLPPARTEAEPTSGPEVDRDPPCTLEVDGIRWEASVVGRALGGPTSAPVPLLLVGFSAPPELEREARETLLVARRLEELSECALAEAFAASQPQSPAGGPRPLFPEIVTKGDRRDG